MVQTDCPEVERFKQDLRQVRSCIQQSFPLHDSTFDYQCRFELRRVVVQKRRTEGQRGYNRHHIVGGIDNDYMPFLLQETLTALCDGINGLKVNMCQQEMLACIR